METRNIFKHWEHFSGSHAILRDGGLNISTDTPYWNNQCLKFSTWKQETFSNIVNICLAQTFALEKGKLTLVDSWLDCGQNPTSLAKRWFSCGGSKIIARFYSKKIQAAIWLDYWEANGDLGNSEPENVGPLLLVVVVGSQTIIKVMQPGGGLDEDCFAWRHWIAPFHTL